MVPTKDRNQSGIFFKYKNEGLLFDCGEGIQRQFKTIDEKITKITKIFISHWHGDHVLGIPGLLQSLNSSLYEQDDVSVEIYGPQGTEKAIKTLLDCFTFDRTISLVVKDFNEGVIFQNTDFFIEVYALEHSIPTFGFRFVEKDRRRVDLEKTKKYCLPEGPLLGKLQQGETITFNKKKIKPEDVTYLVPGKKIAYISDTSLCKNCLKLAQDVDALIIEATYHSRDEEKAEKYKHLTALQAAMIAQQSNAGRLLLTHFSQRYKTVGDLEQEAKDVFPDTVAAYDFLRIKI